jgi:hypothetical protein
VGWEDVGAAGHGGGKLWIFIWKKKKTKNQKLVCREKSRLSVIWSSFTPSDRTWPTKHAHRAALNDGKSGSSLEATAHTSAGSHIEHKPVFEKAHPQWKTANRPSSLIG